MGLAAASVPGVRCFDDADTLAAALAEAVSEGDSVLVKGSRGARMERVLERLRAARRA
jgi:UDP-N-acetylmuramyl pentapeptide synthase